MNKSLKLAFVAGTILFVVPSSYSMFKFGSRLGPVFRKAARRTVIRSFSSSTIKPSTQQKTIKMKLSIIEQQGKNVKTGDASSHSIYCGKNESRIRQITRKSQTKDGETETEIEIETSKQDINDNVARLKINIKGEKDYCQNKLKSAHPDSDQFLTDMEDIQETYNRNKNKSFFLKFLETLQSS